MKKILIDMDDVICGGGILHIVNQYLNTNYKTSDIKTYYIQDIIDEDKLDGFYKILGEKSIYEHTTIYPGAIDVIKKLCDVYDVYICTSFVIPTMGRELGTHIKYKYEWLQNNLPFVKPNKIIFADSKSMLDVDIRIDDRLDKLEGPGSIKILFTAYHNSNISDDELEKHNVIRAADWYDIEKILLAS